MIIRNNGEKSLNILGVKSSNEKLITQFFPSQDGFTYQLTIFVPAPSAGEGPPASEKVTLRTDDPEFGEIEIPIKFNAANAK